ncbi:MULTISPECIES: Crp/Fnr family transcriptional regulator [Nitratiruptor]|uniref:CRP/FNR family transcriptional regulator, anaerobic regulatory protein n=1 Tax=Nitratiruptor tergarcus DSM 16512 TaxID=1069081 RepID=A0A1W1WQX3_9BACT|nr:MULTISPECIES: Crp/Fnr family transcriptional regulator [Nitratiruptor]BCD63087.1 transcriptional regulator, Crp/Fnr family [Nitratiruptor sp. YY08-13]BCD67022.1 transcriptional regulator, Crp/Fnr family [Nitratiruptor sp. YY08-26]SMC08605.1 CRP/FNR family transcriptional regulator, anaerobic regulatory protein [Nitratiruptor tergarcus DSM 16512]
METIKNFYLFDNLPPKQLQRLQEISKTKEFKKGSIAFYEGEITNHLMILTKGILQIYKTDHKGNKIVLHVFYPPNLIAEVVNFEKMPYPATGEFLTDGKVILIDYNIFENEFLKDPEVAFTIIKSLTNKIRYLEHVITNDLVLSSTARVAKFIYEHEYEFMNLKKNEIATLLNITPETLSRIISKFKKAKILQKERNQYIVANKEGLRSFFE